MPVRYNGNQQVRVTVLSCMASSTTHPAPIVSRILLISSLPHISSVIAATIARDAEITWGNLSGIPADIADGDQGITAENDPTVPVELKDGVDWDDISNIPVDIADGDHGITAEVDPQVGGNTTGYIPRWNGSALVTGSFYDNGDRIGQGRDNVREFLKSNPDVAVSIDSALRAKLLPNTAGAAAEEEPAAEEAEA